MAVPTTLVPSAHQVHLHQLEASATEITAVVETTAASAPCPVCGRLSSRVHAWYVRTVADVPWHGVPFRLRLHVRRFFCDVPTCPRAIFTERLPDLVAPYARRTTQLENWLRAVGFAVGGKAGSRLLQALGLVASADTLLRQVRRTPIASTPAPRVVGVDDWCFRRGRRYGAILVDLERRHVLDLLPDREADTLATWLQAHPSIEVISRDRGASFAEGASRGAPQARQVADRFHVLKNLVEAFPAVQAGVGTRARGATGSGRSGDRCSPDADHALAYGAAAAGPRDDPGTPAGARRDGAALAREGQDDPRDGDGVGDGAEHHPTPLAR